MKYIFLTALLILINVFWVSATNRTDSLLLQLDRVVKERYMYGDEKKVRIQGLQELLQKATSDEQRYDISARLFSEYHSFNTDSSIFIARERLNIAERLQRKDYMEEARMNIAEIMGTTGMFKEALELLDNIDRSALPEDLFPYYYHQYRTIYGLMSDYAVGRQEKERYTCLTNLYRDSLLHAHTSGTIAYQLVEADQLNVLGRYEDAITILSDFYEEYQGDEHNKAVSAYTLSESYRLMQNYEKEKEYLILSSTADLKSAVREYISLRKLAVRLYQEGDIDRAYKYLKCSMEDAVLCNARLRLLEILEIFPLVNQSYQTRIEKQKQLMRDALILISVLSVGLLLAIFYVRRQMNKLAVARKDVIDANSRLRDLNTELNRSNVRLTDVNRALAETNHIKEEYIGRYMDLCSDYLDKMETYRRSLSKIAAAGKVDDLYKAIKSSRFIEEELKDFYISFDNTFLRLYPSFVEDFNRLLAVNEKLQLKPGELLNTELRIFALIRLGITDSGKIACFLRYSLTTIYNYRTKMRNKAAGERDEFEKKVMQIGKL